MQRTTLNVIRDAARSRLLFLPHAVRQMARPDRVIEPREVEQVVLTGEIIEDYPTDPRGHSALLLGRGDGGRPLHVVCAPKPAYLAIITAYIPDPTQWSADFRSRA